MPIDLREMLDPAHTAMLVMEMQRGVVGDLSALPHLADEVRDRGVVANTARLATAARGHGVRVIHCTAENRPDGAGSMANCPMLAAMRKRPSHMVAGSDAVRVLPELGPDESDIVSARLHGMSPFTGTELDSILRSLGARTVLATGVSVNVGVLGMVIEAVNLGYRVALVTDAVAGLPREYAEAVIEHTLSLLATRVTVDDVVGAWS